LFELEGERRVRQRAVDDLPGVLLSAETIRDERPIR
jgi:hypothetical protein